MYKVKYKNKLHTTIYDSFKLKAVKDLYRISFSSSFLS